LIAIDNGGPGCRLSEAGRRLIHNGEYSGATSDEHRDADVLSDEISQLFRAQRCYILKTSKLC